eukprot:scaffold625_cov420-Prasinococcus_capsulatus_cf.AAC.29
MLAFERAAKGIHNGFFVVLGHVHSLTIGELAVSGDGDEPLVHVRYGGLGSRERGTQTPPPRTRPEAGCAYTITLPLRAGACGLYVHRARASIPTRTQCVSNMPPGSMCRGMRACVVREHRGGGGDRDLRHNGLP